MPGRRSTATVVPTSVAACNDFISFCSRSCANVALDVASFVLDLSAFTLSAFFGQFAAI